MREEFVTQVWLKCFRCGSPWGDVHFRWLLFPKLDMAGVPDKI